MIANVQNFMMVCLVLLGFATGNVYAASDAETVRTIISSERGVTHSETVSEANLIADLGADELDVVRILMRVESELGVEISDEQRANIATIGDIINAVANAKSGNLKKPASQADLPASFPAVPQTTPEKVTDNAAAEEPIAEEPVVEEPVVEELIEEEPFFEEPVDEEPVAEAPVAEEVADEELFDEEPVDEAE